MFLNSTNSKPHITLYTSKGIFQKKKKKKIGLLYMTKKNVAQTHWQDDVIYKRRKISREQFCYNHSLRKYIQLSLQKVKKIHAIYITSSKTVSKILQST